MHACKEPTFKSCLISDNIVDNIVNTSRSVHMAKSPAKLSRCFCEICVKTNFARQDKTRVTPVPASQADEVCMQKLCTKCRVVSWQWQPNGPLFPRTQTVCHALHKGWLVQAVDCSPGSSYD